MSEAGRMIVDMENVEEWRMMRALVKQLADHAIKNNLYRRGDDFWGLSKDLVAKINLSFFEFDGRGGRRSGLNCEDCVQGGLSLS